MVMIMIWAVGSTRPMIEVFVLGAIHVRVPRIGEGGGLPETIKYFADANISQ